MSHSTRSKASLDYAILDKTGDRVHKERNPKMANKELTLEAININSDVEDFYESYDIDGLNELDELNDYVEKVGNLKQKFRRIYAQIKAVEGEMFDKNFPDYEKDLTELSEKFKNASSKLSGVKKCGKAAASVSENKFETRNFKSDLEQKLLCKSERKFFIDQLGWEMDNCVWNTLDSSEIKDMISVFDSRLQAFLKLCSHLDALFGNEVAEEGLDVENERLISSIRKKISEGHLKISELKSANEFFLQEKAELEMKEKALAEQNRLEKIQKDENKIVDGLLNCAENLRFEIKTRYDIIFAKVNIDLSKLSDFDMLDQKKRDEAIQIELREFMDKISSFEQFVIPCGAAAELLRKEVLLMRDTCTKAVSTFLEDLSSSITKRDISEKKLKNSAGLNINLPKFKGYNSDMDIYTFRSEFSKLVEPYVIKSLWEDYLKKNYLGGAAYNLVAKVEKIEDIWEKLFSVFGNVQLLFQNKLGSLERFSNLEKLKDDEKISFAITSFLNVLSDLSKIAKDFDLEDELYHNGTILKLLALLGKYRERKFIKSIATQKIKSRQKWDKLIVFLTSELKEREAFILNEKAKNCILSDSKNKNSEKEKDKSDKTSFDKKCDSKDFVAHPTSSGSTPKIVCSFCDNSDNHVSCVDGDGNISIEYIACKHFVELTPRERDKTLFRKRFCSKCLKPGVKYNSDHACDKSYVCNQTYVKNGKQLKCGKHVLVCGFHADQKSNSELLDLFKKNVIKPQEKFPEFVRDIKISFFHETHTSKGEDDNESSIFAFQTIKIDDLELNIFYDSGCGDLVVSKDALDKLMQKGFAKQQKPGPITLHGVGTQESISEHGLYSISLPLECGATAVMSGLCVNDITIPFPKYPLDKVEKYFRNEIAKTNPGILSTLPKLPKEVGGRVHIMMGKQYLKYSPNEIAQLKSGLTMYRSRFLSPNGSNGVIAGPHSEFSKIDRITHFSSDKRYTYVTPSVRKYNSFLSLINEAPLLGYKTLCLDDKSQLRDDAFLSKRAPKCLKIFETVENAGINISYRCMKCRNCLSCKKGDSIEEISIQEEIEQDLINNSVTVDFENRVCTAKLPFIADPETRLTPNMFMAKKAYLSQVRRLAKSPEDRNDVIEAEGKLQELRFVDYLENLDQADQEAIWNACVKYFIPWHVVYSKSVTTPVRPVFDGSRSIAGGCSLNDILAKGSNNMNNLVQILIRWTIRCWAYHTDISKMYNAVKLDKSHWHFQLYLWQEELDPNINPKIKVIKTCIYGLKPSGNQAERALRLTAERNKNEYPIAHQIVSNDIYVDDCISGNESKEQGLESTDQLKLSLEKGGFTLKGFTFSGEDPDVKLSHDQKSVGVGGLKWFPKDDYIMLNVPELNFSRKIRGRKSKDSVGVPMTLTMRNCVSKVAELFDPLGRVAPLVASMKLDISNLHRMGLKWDDPIPDNVRELWVSNFEMLQEIGTLRYSRAIVPIDAKNLDIVTLDAGDGSPKLICCAIYARFEKKDGTFSCQLVFARTKVVPEDTTTPRAELMAACMNAATGFTVKKAFGQYHQKAIKLTDSMVALHWIASRRTSLKTHVRTRVVEINRLCDVSTWRHVKSADMIADLGTRQKAKVDDVKEGSNWINGLPWMSRSEDEFPTVTIEDIKLNKVDTAEANKEKIVNDTFYSVYNSESNENLDNEIRERYRFSKYLIDPNKYRFRKVLRILSLVLSFIKKISKGISKIQSSKLFQHKIPGDLPEILRIKGDTYLLTNGSTQNGRELCAGGKVIEISEESLKYALFYFSSKASSEVKKFVQKEKYKNITKEIDGVLYYSGRILSDYAFAGYPDLCGAAIDLCSTTFCVPVMDQYSPVAISIALEIHWYHPDVKHTGVEAMLRQTQRVAHILSGRNLVRFLKSGCHRCRILYKNSVEVEMGPIQSENLCIAPAFFACQIDIFGPFKSYSNANKRATIKVWFLIFCCCTTGAVDIRIMEDYSTDSFVLSFIRFSCTFGYPKVVLPDAGSQLIKGCESINYSFSDCKQILHNEFGVKYEPCPVGAHYVHGKVERKIKEVKKSVKIHINNERLSIIQWETLMSQISNSINNLPIGLKNKVADLDNLDIITPNRLILGRNNNRSPNAPLVLSVDHKKLIEQNAKIFRAWFKAWLISYVPSIIERPKWHKNTSGVNENDIVLFLKSEKEYEEEYQYGIVSKLHPGKDGLVRRVDIQYQNHNEGVKRITVRGIRELIIVHPVDELDIYERLDQCNN